MSGYLGRRAPNVSEYINQLNTMPTTQELAAPNDDFSNLQDDMAIFTNAEFLDFGMADMDMNQTSESERPQSASYTNATSPEGFKADFHFPDFSFGANMDIKPAQPHNLPIGPQTSPVASSPVMEEASRHAAEEDKRRRNTAASARFRIKKKQREQALEKNAKEMSERVAALEAENQQLKMENKWLKGIVVEKGGNTDLRKEAKEETEQADSKDESRKDGVGTTN